MTSELNVLCAGAVKGLVEALEDAFAQSTGAVLRLQSGAVGAMRDALRGGAPCDVLVVTDRMAAELESSGELQAGTRASVGRVRTGVAVPNGSPRPDIADAGGFATALRGASAIYVPDTVRSTAGAHVLAVIGRLGLRPTVEARLRIFPNGATAMRALADAGDPLAIGCTQVTEIRYTAGVALVGPLPAEFELTTVYAAALAAGAADPALARRFVELLTGPASQGLRDAGGFDP